MASAGPRLSCSCSEFWEWMTERAVTKVGVLDGVDKGGPEGFGAPWSEGEVFNVWEPVCPV